MMIRRRAACSALALVLLASPAGAAEHPSAALTYLRGPGAELCPDEAKIRREVSIRLGYPAFSGASRLRLTVSITREKGGFVGVIKAEGEDGPMSLERRLTAPTCDQLADAVQTLVGIMIDPDPSKRPPPPPYAPVLPRLAISAGLAAHVAMGTAPRPAPGMDVYINAHRGDLSFSLEGRWDAPLSAVRDASGDGLRSWLLVGTLVPCVHHRILLGCGLFSVGVQDVSAFVPRHQDVDRSRFYAAVGVRGGAEARLFGPLSGRLVVDMSVPLINTPNVLRVGRQPRDKWTPSPVAAALGLGLTVRFF